LLAINPNKELSNLYSSETINNQIGKSTENPHVFAIAERTHRELIKDGKDRSILISGCAGSGKTETVKILLTYFAAASKSISEGSGIRNAEDRLLKSLYLIELFGNAKMPSNNNSSRFGKYIDVSFTPNGSLVGAEIQIIFLRKQE